MRSVYWLQKNWPHTLARRREAVTFGHWGSKGGFGGKKPECDCSQILSSHTLASLICNVGDPFPPHAAVILISWVSRDKTPLTYCLIICTSPEINYDVKCLWAGGSGGVSSYCGRGVYHMQQYQREKESGVILYIARPPPYSQWGVTHLLRICLVHIQLTWSCGLTEGA